MVTTPWRQLSPVAPEREYLALISFLPLKRFSKMFRFMAYARSIAAQLETTRGILGYSFRAKPLRKEFYTLSLWQDEASLAAFIPQVPHGRIMAAMQGEMGETKFVRWRRSGAEGVPTWDEGLRRLAVAD